MNDRKIEELIRALEDSNSDVRQKAAEALGKIGDARAVEPLIKALENNNIDVRARVARALGEIGDTRAVKPLIRVLEDNVFCVRIEVIVALGTIGDTRAIKPLIKALRNRHESVRWPAAEALDKLHWSPASELETAYYLIAKKVWNKGVLLGVPAVELLIKALVDGDSIVRRYAAEVLGRTGDARAVEPLIRALGDNDLRVRGKVSEALGKIGKPAVIPLLAVLKDSNASIREIIVKILVEIGTPAVDLLITTLEDKNSSVRKSIVIALGNIRDVSAVEQLVAVLRDDNSDVRGATSEALVKIDPDWHRSNAAKRQIPEFIVALRDANKGVQVKVAAVLGKIGDARAVEPLIRALGDKNADVRCEVVETLEKLMWKPKTEIEKAYYLVAKKEWGSVVSLGLASVEPLITVISDSDSGIQRSAFEVLNKNFPQIIEIIFGENPSNNSSNTIKNVDVSKLTIPMSSLTKIHIDADTYDFDMVERFITYSINYVGQKHLRKKVEVCIYGNPDKLHPNLLNSFKNLCRKVIFCE